MSDGIVWAEVPGSKSVAHRALVCAALAQGASRVSNLPDSEDIRNFLEALRGIGVPIREILATDEPLTPAPLPQGERGKQREVEVGGGWDRTDSRPVVLDLGASGTGIRLMAALAALREGETVLTGIPRLLERPMEPLLDALRSMGRKIERGEKGEIVLRQGSIRGGEVEIAGSESSQFMSALLLIAPAVPGGAAIRVKGEPVSWSYVEMTKKVMESFASRYKVEADASSASYFWEAGALTGRKIGVRGVRGNSCQGDVAAARFLEKMGCDAGETEEGIWVQGRGELKGIREDFRDTPDLVPTFAVLGLFAAGGVRMEGIPHLRFKESDRIGVLAEELEKCGGNVTVGDDFLEVRPGKLRPAQLHCHNDHRMAMAFSLLKLKIPEIELKGTECVSKSFPGFFKEWQRLGFE